jgi:diguanylate cyclase (GGDEF)-like protein
MQSATFQVNPLLNFFAADKLQQLLSTMAKATGFSLSVYSQKGRLIYATPAVHPLCEAIQAASISSLPCGPQCRNARTIMLKENRSRIFKCGTNIVNFTLPVENEHVKVVVLGQGSFADYDDLRDFTVRFHSLPLRSFSLTMPPTFTSIAQARNISSLLEISLLDLLRNSQENASLQRRIAGLRAVLSGWTSSSRNDPDSIYQQLLTSLSAFVEGRSLALLIRDRQQQGQYVRQYPNHGDEGAVLPAAIDQQHPLLQRLLAGELYVFLEEKRTAPDMTSRGDGGGCLLFPVVVNGRIESLLAVTGAVPSESDVQMLTAFCRQTALMMENNGLHQDLYQRFERLNAVSKLTETITTTQNYQVLLQTILEQSADLLLAEQGSLMLIDQETNALLVEASKGAMGGDKDKIRIPKGEGIAGKVADLGVPMLVENIEQDPRIGKKSRSRYKTSSFVSVPLKTEQRIMGVLNLTDKTTGEAFNEEDLQLAQAFAAHAAAVLERVALSEQMDKLKKLSITDDLTGLFNRRYLLDRMEEELSRSQRYDRQMSILMLDLDHLKQFNDSFGQPTGDRILAGVAVTIMNSIRSIDIAARYGGDEFVVILPETDMDTALLIAERIRSSIAETPPTATRDNASPVRLTVSIGIACCPQHGETVDGLLKCVDEALYRAKDRGKNRTELCSSS